MQYSCNHEINYAGHVYSRHNYPVENVNVSIEYSSGGRSQGGIVSAKSDVTGYFHINKYLSRRESAKEIRFNGDSGSYSAQVGPNNSDLNIYLK